MKTNTLKKQTGAVGLMMAAMMLVLVLFTALALDTARLHYQQQALQSVADIAALEVSRANPYFIAGDNSELEQTLEAKYKNEGQVDTLSIQTGAAKLSEGKWVFEEESVSEDVPYSAAKVIVKRTVPRSMIASGFFDNEEVTLTAQAAIQQTGVVRLGVGSELISADLSIVDLSAVSYGGLVKSNIRLNDVISVLPNVDLATMTPNEILTTEISVSDLLYAYADVLRLNHDEDGEISVFKSELSTIASLVNGLSSVPNLTLGQLIELSSTQPYAALGANIDALGLVKATLYAANKVNGITAPEISINIPGVVSANSTLKLIEAPQFKVGLLPIKEGDEFSVSTEQVDLTANISILSNTLTYLEKLLNALPLLDNPVKVEISPIAIHAKGAQATARLLSDNFSNNLNLKVNQSLGSITIDDFEIRVTVEVGISSWSLVKVPIDIRLTQNDSNGEVPDLGISSQEVDIPVQLSALPFEETIYAENISINTHLRIASSEPDFSGGILNSVVQGLVLPLVVPIVNSLISTLPSLLSPIINDVLVQSLSGLGINIGSTTVWVDAAGMSQFGLIE